MSLQRRAFDGSAYFLSVAALQSPPPKEDIYTNYGLVDRRIARMRVQRLDHYTKQRPESLLIFIVSSAFIMKTSTCSDDCCINQSIFSESSEAERCRHRHCRLRVEPNEQPTDRPKACIQNGTEPIHSITSIFATMSLRPTTDRPRRSTDGWIDHKLRSSPGHRQTDDEQHYSQLITHFINQFLFRPTNTSTTEIQSRSSFNMFEYKHAKTTSDKLIIDDGTLTLNHPVSWNGCIYSVNPYRLFLVT